MKVLILSCNTGGGHNAAASALKESLNFYHHEAEVLDLMSLGRKHTPFTMQMRGLEMRLQIILFKTILMPLSPHIFIRRKH